LSYGYAAVKTQKVHLFTFRDFPAGSSPWLKAFLLPRLTSGLLLINFGLLLT